VSWGLLEGVLTLVHQPGLRGVGLHCLSASVALNATLILLAAGLMNVCFFPLISRRRAEKYDLTAGTALFWFGLNAAAFLLFVMKPSLTGLSGEGVSGSLVFAAAVIGVLVAAWQISRVFLRAARYLFGGIRAGMRKTLMTVVVLLLFLAYLDYGLMWFLVRLRANPEVNGPNVMLIIIDTVRADHVSLFGYGRETTPYLEKLAGRGVAFSQAICQYPSSLGSHASILTSLYPGSHCTYEHVPSSCLPDEITTLAEYFENAGYRTIGILDNPWLSRRFGFTQGYGVYINANRIEVMNTPSFRLITDRLLVMKFSRLFSEGREQSTDSAVSALREMGGKPFFMFLHYLTPHRPYHPPAPYDRMFFDPEADGPEIRGGMQQGLFKLAKLQKIEIGEELLPEFSSLYDGDIAYTDRQVGYVLEELEALGLTGSTMVVVISDHGENFVDEKPWFVGHGGLTEGGIHVPLVMSYPPLWNTPKTVDRVVELVDVMPTILDIAGIPPTSQLEGQDLVPLTTDSESGKDIAFVQLHSDEYAVRTGDWKLRIREVGDGLEATRQLFDITGGSDIPCRETDPSIADSLFELYVNWKADRGCRAGQPDGEESFDSETYEKLKALGYLQ